jgi:hypothetical protein
LLHQIDGQSASERKDIRQIIDALHIAMATLKEIEEEREREKRRKEIESAVEREKRKRKRKRESGE